MLSDLEPLFYILFAILSIMFTLLAAEERKFTYSGLAFMFWELLAIAHLLLFYTSALFSFLWVYIGLGLLFMGYTFYLVIAKYYLKAKEGELELS